MSPAVETAEAVLAEEVAEAPAASRAVPAEAALAAPKAVLTQTETPPAAEVAAAEEAAIQQAAIQETAVQNATQDADAQGGKQEKIKRTALRFFGIVRGIQKTHLGCNA